MIVWSGRNLRVASSPSNLSTFHWSKKEMSLSLKILVNVGFVVWKASWVGILTIDQLKRKGWSMSNKLYICEKEEELANHFLLHCPIASVP